MACLKGEKGVYIATFVRIGCPLGKRGTGVERNSGVKHAQAWAVQGGETPWEEGC